MRAILLAILMICIPTSYAQCSGDNAGCYHTPGYYFLFLDGNYYPDYQEPQFYSNTSDCNCPCEKPCCDCNPTFSSKKHYYRHVNDEGLSMEYYIR